MSIAKVIEVISEGKTVDESIKNAVAEASKTVENIRQVNVEHIEAIVEKNKVVKFRTNVMLTFVVEN